MNRNVTDKSMFFKRELTIFEVEAFLSRKMQKDNPCRHNREEDKVIFQDILT